MFNSIKDLDNPVPATLPFKPLLANTPSKAAVFSILTPVALAAGATIFILSLNASKFNAELDVLKAITSTTLAVSSVVRPKALTVEPANSAADAKSTSNEEAKLSIAGVEFAMSDAVKPSFASSVCNFTTSTAVN